MPKCPVQGPAPIRDPNSLNFLPVTHSTSLGLGRRGQAFQAHSFTFWLRVGSSSFTLIFPLAWKSQASGSVIFCLTSTSLPTVLLPLPVPGAEVSLAEVEWSGD